MRTAGCPGVSCDLPVVGEVVLEIPDLSRVLYSAELHRDANACSVGWLGANVPRKGVLSPDLLQALRHYSERNYHEDWELGYHTCEICGQVEGHGEFSVEWNGIRYVL